MRARWGSFSAVARTYTVASAVPSSTFDRTLRPMRDGGARTRAIRGASSYLRAVDEAKLKEKLRLIEALFAGATTDGERVAAGEARKRIQLRLAGIEKIDAPIEYRFSMPDAWSRKIFRALLRRYDLKPYRYRGQRHATIMVRASKSFVNDTLWPEYQQISDVLRSFIDETTDRVIAESIHDDSSDVTEVAQPAQLTAAARDVEEA